MDIVVVTCATFHMHTGLWNHTGIGPGPEMQSPIHSLQVISRGTSQPLHHNMFYLEYSSQHKVLTKHKY